ncbi:hypothetical protein PROFUN_05389 [Planoprotostelium fungivorum]|uniref:Uncharacterized protein n=1 Tax=Planoprotostelium fungivorum TaxID=1890364 RepID=A0A2P6NQS6_9EUKA|nr:hypothetical protein PROFUN_05389 [Planoprotostelium fungivorum]
MGFGGLLKSVFIGQTEEAIIKRETVLDSAASVWFAVIRPEGDNSYFKDILASYFLESEFEIVTEGKSKITFSHPKLKTHITAAFGKNDKDERILQINYDKAIEETNLKLYLPADEVPLYYKKLLDDFGHRLGSNHLLNGQTGPLPDVKRHHAVTHNPSASIPISGITMTSEDIIKQRTVWNKKNKLWVAYVRADCPKEYLKILFINFIEERSFVITRVAASTIEAESSMSGALKSTITMKIGFNQNNERLIHINYVEKTAECFTRTDFFRDFSRELEAVRFFEGQIEPLVRPRLAEGATTLYKEEKDSHDDHHHTFDDMEQVDISRNINSPVTQSANHSPPQSPVGSPVGGAVAPGMALRMQKQLQDQIRKEEIEEEILADQEERLAEEEAELKLVEEQLRQAEKSLAASQSLETKEGS